MMRRRTQTAPKLVGGLVSILGSVLMARGSIAHADRSSAAQSSGGIPAFPQVLVADGFAMGVRIYSEYPAPTYSRNSVEVRGRVCGHAGMFESP